MLVEDRKRKRRFRSKAPEVGHGNGKGKSGGDYMESQDYHHIISPTAKLVAPPRRDNRFKGYN